jgi:RNA polymerase sigma-70 factor (ECF subfamily)
VTPPARRTLDDAALADAPLLAAARAGDRDAFDVLARRHVPRLVGTALRLLRDRAAAEEAAADALIRAYGGLRAMRGDASFGTWTHRIVCRVAIDRLRARRRAPLPLDDLAAEPGDPRAAAGRPDDRLERSEQVARVRRAIEALPEAQRLVVVLHAWEGLAYADVAVLLGCSYDAVRVNMCHARKSLRARFPLRAEDRP